MRRMLTSLSLLAALFLASPALAQGCTAEVLTAFEKQRTSKAFRMETTQPSAEGEVKVTVDYVPPDKMLQTVVSPAMPGEQQTMLVGNRAFAGTSGSYEELLPQFTQSILAELQTALGKPKNVGEYDCLGRLTFENRDLTGYRLHPAADKGIDPAKAITRTLYVDPATGLPAYNVVSPASGGEVMVKIAYSYPTNIEIVAPEHAPVQRSH